MPSAARPLRPLRPTTGLQNPMAIPSRLAIAVRQHSIWSFGEKEMHTR